MTEAGRTTRLNDTAFQILIIILCVVAANFNTLFNGFVYDDTWQIVTNEWITDTKYLADIFSKDATHADSNTVSNYYRPLMNVVYMATYHLFGGLRAWGFHLVNVLLHTGVALLVFRLASRLLERRSCSTALPWLSLPTLTALIFALNPVNSEVVAWAACIPELTFSLFCLLTLSFHMTSQKCCDRGHLLSLLCFTIALFCKETSVVVVAVLAAYDIMFRPGVLKQRITPLRYLAFAAAVALYMVIRLQSLGGLAPAVRHPELNSYEVIINTVPLFGQYLLKFLLPINLNAFYVLDPVHSPADPQWLMYFAVTAAWFVLGWRLFTRDKTALLGFVIATVPLLPVLYIRGLGENTFADRYLYFPGIGFALMAGALVRTVGRNARLAGWPAAVLILAVLTAYSLGTIRRNSVWRSSLSLWSDTAQKSPDSYMVRNELGVALMNAGRQDAAIREYETALKLKPDSSEIHTNLALALANKGELDAAIREYRSAIRLNPRLFEAHYNLGLTLFRTGDREGARNELQKALSIMPSSNVAHFHLGLVLGQSGDIEGEIREYRTSLSINKNLFDARYNLGLALMQKGELDSAISELVSARRMNTAFPGVYFDLGNAYVRRGDVDRAIQEFRSGLQLSPGNSQARATLDNLMRQSSR